MADPGSSVPNDRDILKDRILKLIPPADHAKVDLNAGLRYIKDNALSYETAAEELINEIHEAWTKAKWSVRMADDVKEQKNQAVRYAMQVDLRLREDFVDWQEHYESFSSSQYQAIQQAKNVTRQAMHEYAQACEVTDRCREVAMFKERLGMLAIGAMLDDQQKHTRDALHKISRTLEAQQEAQGGEASVA